MYDVSILVPGIRNNRWNGLYKSISQACSRKWELIFVGPKALPIELQNKQNVKYIQDFGPPTRCRQQALIESEGDWIFYAGDDLSFMPNSFDVAFDKLDKLDKLDKMDASDNTVLLGKYTEGKRDNPEMLSDDYYTFKYHDSTRALQQRLSYKAWIIMAGLVPTKLLKKLGGWDCQFNVCAVACLDLALRLQNHGINLIIHDEPFFHAEHLPDLEGDHGPIAHSQTYYDMPLLHQIYSQPDCEKRTIIPIDNWKNSPKIWKLRFEQN